MRRRGFALLVALVLAWNALALAQTPDENGVTNPFDQTGRPPKMDAHQLGREGA